MIQLVVFDWAGTIIDFGSLAPLSAYRRVFAEQGVEVSADEIRPHMGLHKRDHLESVLRSPAVAERWAAVRGTPWATTDIDRMYQQFMPIQLEELQHHNQLIPGALECMNSLRARGVLTGGSTGYFRKAVETVTSAARDQGLELDCNIGADDAPVGRPAPWMIYRNMERLGVFPPSTVVKVGDTVADIREGINAGAWSVGVTTSGSEVGLAEIEWRKLSDPEQSALQHHARERLLAAGAHAVINSLVELPDLIRRLNGDTPRVI